MTREEAIKILRERHSSALFSERTALETLIPELKESEDERIRKVLVDMVKRETGFTGFPSQGQVLAYLEKQKEPDGIWTEEDDAKVKAMCKEGDLKPSERAWLKELKNRIVQKEQKPSIKSINIDQLKSLMLQYLQEASNEKEDSDIEADTDKWARKILGYDFKQKPTDVIDPFDDGQFRRGYESGHADAKREQKPAEWSKEDEKMLLSIINAFRKGAVSTIGQEQWLKLLPERFNLQPKKTDVNEQPC